MRGLFLALFLLSPALAGFAPITLWDRVFAHPELAWENPAWLEGAGEVWYTRFDLAWSRSVHGVRAEHRFAGRGLGLGLGTGPGVRGYLGLAAGGVGVAGYLELPRGAFGLSLGTREAWGLYERRGSGESVRAYLRRPPTLLGLAYARGELELGLWAGRSWRRGEERLELAWGLELAAPRPRARLALGLRWRGPVLGGPLGLEVLSKTAFQVAALGEGRFSLKLEPARVAARWLWREEGLRLALVFPSLYWDAGSLVMRAGLELLAAP